MATPFQRLTELELSRRDRLILYYLAGLGLLVTFYMVTYNLVMSRLEGVDQSIFASFEFVVQTMTTTGYGQDAGQWSHPLTYLFVALTQISGIGITSSSASTAATPPSSWTNCPNSASSTC